MRNWWLAAIAGLQGNAPSNISPEGPAGAKGTGEIGRPGCGLPGTWAVALVGGGAGQRAEAPIEARGADGSRAAHGAARPYGRARR